MTSRSHPSTGDGEPRGAGPESHGFDFAPPPQATPPETDAARRPPASASDTTDLVHPQTGAGATRRRRNPKPRGRKRGSNGRWVFATLIAAISLIVGGIAWAAVLDYQSSGVEPAELGTTGSLHTGQLVSGMCIKTAPATDAEPGPVEVVRCSDPHHAEAVASYTFTTLEWPGRAQARSDVLSFCAAQLDPAVSGIPPSPDAPDYEWLAWLPSSDTWRLGDRTALCIVTTERPVAGSYATGTAHDATTDAVVG